MGEFEIGFDGSVQPVEPIEPANPANNQRKDGQPESDEEKAKKKAELRKLTGKGDFIDARA